MTNTNINIDTNTRIREVDFALSRMFYMFGQLEASDVLSDSIEDLDQIEEICVKIADDWSNKVDIQSHEEEGYPTAYAERVLLENYGRGKKLK